MDDWTSFEVQGLEELDAKLEGLTNELAGKALYSALSFATTPMLKEAKARAPETEEAYRRYSSTAQGKKKFSLRRRSARYKAKRGEGKYEIQQPGTLKRSIRRQRLTKIREFNEGGAAIGIFVKNKRSDLPPYYWYFIEYGTSKMPAVPFLRPAFDNNTELAIERFSAKLSKNIDRFTE